MFINIQKNNISRVIGRFKNLFSLEGFVMTSYINHPLLKKDAIESRLYL